MGAKKMRPLWNRLTAEFQNKTISKENFALYKKWGKAVKNLASNPQHPGLATHKIDQLSKRYGKEVWQSYLENNTPAAGRMFWAYGPNRGEITVIGLEPHPESTKAAYNQVDLDSLGKKKEEEEEEEETK